MTEDPLPILDQNRDAGEPWDMMGAKTGGMTNLYLSCFDMLPTEEASWLAKVSDSSSIHPRLEPQDEPEQCPVIDSQEQGLSPGLEGQEEDRSLEQVQSMVVGEVLKDIETACKLLNIAPGRPLSITPAPSVYNVSMFRCVTDKGITT